MNLFPHTVYHLFLIYMRVLLSINLQGTGGEISSTPCNILNSIVSSRQVFLPCLICLQSAYTCPIGGEFPGKLVTYF
jgi:hypothetical protein